MQIEKRTLNWLPKQSLYDETIARQEKRKAEHEEFMTSTTALAEAFGTVRTDTVMGMSEIAANAAAQRVNLKV